MRLLAPTYSAVSTPLHLADFLHYLLSARGRGEPNILDNHDHACFLVGFRCLEHMHTWLVNLHTEVRLQYDVTTATLALIAP